MRIHGISRLYPIVLNRLKIPVMPCNKTMKENIPTKIDEMITLCKYIFVDKLNDFVAG